MQCRVDVVHRCERRGWDLRVDGRGECTEYLAAVGAHDRGTDENASVDILHEKNESIVAGSVDPPSRRRGDSRIAGANPETAFPSLGLRETDSTNLWIGERRPGQPVVAAEQIRPTQQVGYQDARLPYRDVSERSPARDVADAVEPVDTDDPHLIVHVKRAGAGIQAHLVQRNVSQVGSASDAHEHFLSRDRAAVSESDLDTVTAGANGCRPDADL